MKSLPPPLTQSAKRVLVVLFFGLLGLLLATYMTAKSGASERTCIFCSIVADEIHTTIEKETDDYMIFKDIKPESKHHYLAVSKRHIESVKALTKADEKLVINMEAGLKELFQSKDIDTDDALFGFHLPPFTSVQHLHMHAISPRSTMGYFKRLMFMPGTWWFHTVAEARDMIQKKV